MKILYYIIHSISINQNTYFDVSNKYRNCLKLSSILLINETRWIVGLRPASLLGLRRSLWHVDTQKKNSLICVDTQTQNSLTFVDTHETKNPRHV